MNFFRKLAGPMVALVSITFLAWMVFDLSGITGNRGFARSRAAGSVNDQSLDSRDYELMVQRASEQQQRQNQGTLGADDYARLRDQVWNEWVDQAVLLSEYHRRGLSVSDEELADAIRSTPLPEIAQNESFKTDGQFDMAKYQRWLSSASAAQALPILEERYRAEMLRAKLLRVVSADIFISDAELWLRYRDENETAKVDLAAIIPRNAVPDSAVPLTDAEVQAFYTAHGDQFKRPETAYLSYVMVPRGLDAADSAAALARIRDVRAQIVAGAKFEDVARRESEDAGSAANGGDLGEWTKGKMVAQFDSVAFKIPVGQLSEPFLSPFGYHILQVTSRTGDKVKGRHILVNIELAGAHRERVDAVADTLERLAADRVDPAALDTAARALGLRVMHALPLQKGTSLQAGTSVVPNVGTWAFQRATPGAIGTVEETTDALYLFRIDSMTPAGLPPLASIRTVVEHEARQAKKWERARVIGAELQKRLDEGASLDMATHALGLPHQVIGPFTRINPPFPNPTFIGTAFSLQPGQRSKVIDTPEGLYLVESVARTPADSAAFVRQKDELRTHAITLMRQDRVRLYLQALRDNAKIVDHREDIQREAEKQRAAADAQTAAGR
ncbi:MAG: SurA N-terminal domain-containing protein [Gemmatimonadetes bacterium]|nr:SurA N-terminal domain-containing protein [Gemmatimonadota bacterium]